MKVTRVLGSVLLVGSTVAFADGHVKVGGLFRGEIATNDRESTEFPGSTAAQRTIDNKAYFNWTLDAQVNENVTVDSEIRLLGGGAGCVENFATGANGFRVKHAFVSANMGAVRASAGCHKVRHGGWNNMDYNESYDVRPDSIADEDFGIFHPTYAPSLEVEYVHSMWSVALQVLDDVKGRPDGGWNDKENIAVALDWRGNFAGIQPIVQFGLYDSEQSKFWAVGVKGEMAGLWWDINYASYMHSKKVQKGNKSDSDEDTANRASVHLQYMTHFVTPFFYYSWYDLNKKTNDVDANQQRPRADLDNVYDDNQQVFSAGARFHFWGDNVTPYIAVDRKGGKFLIGTNQSDDQFDMIARIGASAWF